MNIKYLNFLCLFLLVPLFLKGEVSHMDTQKEVIQNKKVLISGAGISGLTLAFWLKQYGFEPTIVEKHAILRTGGYKIDIRGAALDVIKKMDLFEKIYEARTQINSATVIYSGGEKKEEMDVDLCGGRTDADIEILRGNLCHILYQNLGDVEFLFNDSVSNITQDEKGVLVEFEKNSPRRFDLVVGADGLHSVVRKLALAPEKDCLEKLGLCVSVYTIPNFLNLDKHEIEYFEPQKLVNVYSYKGDASAKAGFAFALDYDFDYTDKLAQQNILKKAFSDLGWEVPRLLAEMQNAPDFYLDVVAQIHLQKWSNNRVAVVGDAGYAPSPISGQGTSVAIVGAYVLARELSVAKGDYKLGYQEYEKKLRRFVKKNQELIELSVGVMTGKENTMSWWYKQLIEELPENKVIELFKKMGVKQIYEAANEININDL